MSVYAKVSRCGISLIQCASVSQVTKWHRFLHPANQSQFATPPWCEHVPLALRLKLYEPSRHCALAPVGALPEMLRVGA
jgi:hypothetical protein